MGPSSCLLIASTTCLSKLPMRNFILASVAPPSPRFPPRVHTTNIIANTINLIQTSPSKGMTRPMYCGFTGRRPISTLRSSVLFQDALSHSLIRATCAPIFISPSSAVAANTTCISTAESIPYHLHMPLPLKHRLIPSYLRGHRRWMKSRVGLLLNLRRLPVNMQWVHLRILMIFGKLWPVWVIGIQWYFTSMARTSVLIICNA